MIPRRMRPWAYETGRRIKLVVADRWPESVAAMFLVAIYLLLAGCSHTPPPEKPKQHTLNAELYCYVIESERGAGMVCTEIASACRALQGLTAVAEGVTAISQCRKADVIADTKE